jgi:hypothetical protein
MASRSWNALPLRLQTWRHFGGNRSFVTNRLLAQAQSFVFS